MERVVLQNACKNFEEDLVLYYYGECDATEQRRVGEHLTLCGSCRGFVDDLRHWLPQIAQAEPMTPAFWDDYYRETVSKLEPRKEREPWWHSWFAPKPMWMVPAFGTVGVMLLVVGMLFGKGNLTSFMQRPTANIPQEVLADEDQLQFFESMDLLESLSRLEKQDDSNHEKTNPQSSRALGRQETV
jgi:hypothetical protein